MAQWDAMLASVGIGSAKMTVHLAEVALYHGCTFGGTVELAGGEVSQHIEQILISVGYTTIIMVGKAAVPIYHEVAKTVIAETFDIAPGQTQTLPFEITLPDPVPNGLSLSAQADIPGAVDPRASIQLELSASPEMLLIDEAMQSLGFEAKAEFRSSGLYTGRFDINYAVPIQLRAAVENVSLWLRRQGSEIIGALDINHEERSLADTMKSLIRQDHTKASLLFTGDDLYNADKQPRREHLASVLKSAFESALKLSDDEKATLLRASFPPDISEELLRPAADTDADAANLLRSSSNAAD